MEQNNHMNTEIMDITQQTHKEKQTILIGEEVLMKVKMNM